MAPSRLCIVLEPAAVLRVLDRLVVLDLLPNALNYRRLDSGDAEVQMEWDDIDHAKMINLRDRLTQLPAVSAVRLGGSS